MMRRRGQPTQLHVGNGLERFERFVDLKRFRILAVAVAILAGGCSGGGSSPAQSSDAIAMGSSVLPAASASKASPTAAPSAEVPYQSDSLVDSIGMNTHFAAGGNWTSIFGTAESDLISLGIRHIRDGWPGPSGYAGEMQKLAAAGIHADIITYYGETAADIRSIAPSLTPALESYESPNEYDCSGDPNWAADLKVQQQTLYSAVGGTHPVYGPAMCAASDYSTVGDLRASLDYGNLHNYLSGHNPGSIGWGGQFAICGNTFYYGSIDFNLGCTENVSGPLSFARSSAYPEPASGSSFDSYLPSTGSKPVITTENGYGTMPSTPTSVDSTTQAKYVPRLLLMQYAAGIRRTYWYELIDEATPCVSVTACYGLTDASGKVFKPAFSALQGLISTLMDPGASFATTPLAYSFGGGPATLAHLLFQKRNGQYTLALWNETSSWNVNNGTGSPVTVSPISTTVELPFAPSGLRVSAFNDAGTLVKIAPVTAGGNVTLNVDDHVSLITFSHP